MLQTDPLCVTNFLEVNIETNCSLLLFILILLLINCYVCSLFMLNTLIVILQPVGLFFMSLLFLQMILKNLTDNAKNIAANAKIEDMSRLIKNHMAGNKDIKNPLSGVMVTQLHVFHLFYYLE
jgi:hypothetical protein